MEQKEEVIMSDEICDECEDGLIRMNCISCNGSGEGSYDESTCRTCGGNGCFIAVCACKEGNKYKDLYA